MPWVVNPKTKKPVKVGSRFFKFLNKEYNFTKKDYINPSSIPPNDDIDSREYREWIFTMHDYFQNKELEKKPKIEIINLSESDFIKVNKDK